MTGHDEADDDDTSRDDDHEPSQTAWQYGSMVPSMVWYLM